MKSGWLQIWRHPLFQNVLILYGVQAANFLLPLVAMPYVARILKPEAWGTVVFAQSFAVWLAIIVEYGFIFSATREIAEHRSDTAAVQSIVSGVFGAKIVLSLAMSIVTAAAYFTVPLFGRSDIVLWTWVLALSQGMSSFWYFQGIEKVHFAAILEMLGRLIAVIGIFVLVKHPKDIAIVIFIQAFTAFVTTIALLFIMYRDVAFEFPKLKNTIVTLKKGFSMFFYRICVSLYTSANSLILGTMTNSTEVGYYGSAERIVTAANAVYWPFWRAIYPRITYNLQHSRAKATRLARLSLILSVGYGIMASFFFVVLSPHLVPVILGSGYEPVIPILQILACIIPFVGASGSLGLQWMIPNKFDKYFNRFTLLTGIFNVSISLFLINHYKSTGSAISVLISEILITVAFAGFLARKKVFLA